MPHWQARSSRSALSCTPTRVSTTTTVGLPFKAHHTVNHSEQEYARGDVSTNQAENFFSQLKRSIDGTHHHVSVDHLPRYLAEFSFRYTYRKETDTERMTRLVGHVSGRRLMYREPAPGLSWN